MQEKYGGTSFSNYNFGTMAARAVVRDARSFGWPYKSDEIVKLIPFIPGRQIK